MATNPYRDFGLHPDEFGPQPSSASPPGSTSAQQSSTAPQPLSSFPTPNAPKPSGGSFNWGRIGMVLLAIVVVGVPKLFMHQQRQARVRADRDPPRQMRQFQLPQAPQVRGDDAEQRAKIDKAVRQIKAQMEAARAGKQKMGEAFNNQAAEKDAE